MHAPRPRPRAVTLLLLAGLAAAALAGCDNHHHWWADEWDISVENRTPVTLDIWLDARYVLSVTGGTSGTIEGVAEGWHTLEAYDLEGRLRASRSFDLASSFLWILD